MQLAQATEEDGQGLGWGPDVVPAAPASFRADPVPVGDDTLPAVDTSDESDPELLPDLGEREDLKDAPPYFLAAMRIQAEQTRGDVKRSVTKSLKKTNKQLSGLAAGVQANSRAIQSNQSAILDLKKANDKLEKEVGENPNVSGFSVRVFWGRDVSAFLEGPVGTALTFMAQVMEGGRIEWDADGLCLIGCTTEHAVRLKMIVATRRR